MFLSNSVDMMKNLLTTLLFDTLTARSPYPLLFRHSTNSLLIMVTQVVEFSIGGTKLENITIFELVLWGGVKKCNFLTFKKSIFQSITKKSFDLVTVFAETKRVPKLRLHCSNFPFENSTTRLTMLLMFCILSFAQVNSA